MIIHDAFARPGDTVTLTIDISNTAKFVSFQFDLQLPQGLSYLGYSLRLSDRSVNHVAIGNMVGANSLRIFSYSPNNAAFKGGSGMVVSFSLVVGNIRGEFPLTLENGIIGDSLSTNILNGVENGILSVFPMGLNEHGEYMNDSFGLTVIPNPFIDHAHVSFTLADFSAVTIILYDQDGKKVTSTDVGNFGKEKHTLDLPNEMMKQLKPGKMYYIDMSVKPKTGAFCNMVVKIIRIEK
jgi:uncharacterized repeat protein (TIGR01451 family)